MVGKILNTSFTLVSIVDVFESFIWTDRYNEAGDFELCVDASTENFSRFVIGYYLEIEESDRTMIIETLETTFDPDQGSKLIVSGRSLESILDRRIIWEEFTMASEGQDKKLYKCVEKCLSRCILSGYSVAANRVVSNLSYISPSSSSALAEVTVDEETQASIGDNLYDIIVSLCQDKHVGFKILRDGSQFKMSLYLGTDRSYNQSSRPYVVFSYDFDNIVNLNYLDSVATYKTTALIIGEGEASSAVRVVVNDGYTGLNRREVKIDPDNCSKGELTDAKYKELLSSKGKIEIASAEYCRQKVFSGEIEADKLFKYNTDFTIGDIVEVRNEIGTSGHCRITEFIRTEDTSGMSFTPSFVDISTEK